MTAFKRATEKMMLRRWLLKCRTGPSSIRCCFDVSNTSIFHAYMRLYTVYVRCYITCLYPLAQCKCTLKIGRNAMVSISNFIYIFNIYAIMNAVARVETDSAWYAKALKCSVLRCTQRSECQITE